MNDHPELGAADSFAILVIVLAALGLGAYVWHLAGGWATVLYASLTLLALGSWLIFMSRRRRRQARH